MNYLRKMLLFSCILLPVTSFAVTISSVRVLDSLRTPRSAYSSSENITLAAEVLSSEKGASISFDFTVTDPSGVVVFHQTGNAIPGTIGSGGSEVGNVPLSRLYTSAGNYTLKVTATPLGGAPASQSTMFSVYSPIVTLSYPANGALDLMDQPLIFRWVGSGASQYRITFGDNMGFYNPLLIANTMDASFTYPMAPTDQRQRLAGGQVYYWKVEGIDSAGNTVARSPVPFSFSLKKSGSSSTRDLAITAIVLDPSVAAPQMSLNVDLKNNGGAPENNVTITLYAAGMQYGTKQVPVINANETKTINFIIDAPDVTPGAPLFVSAMHNVFDDDPKNNILTVALKPDESFFKAKYAKVSGQNYRRRQTERGLEDIKISYSGPSSGEVYSGAGGQYKIENLLPGDYKLTATNANYEPAELSVTLEKGKAYPNNDLVLIKKAGPAVYSLDEIWSAIKPGVGADIIKELDGYGLSDVSGVDKDILMNIVTQLKSGNAKVTSATLTK